MPTISAIRDTVRQFGPRRALLYAMDRVLQAVSRGAARLVAYELWAQRVPATSVLPPRRGASLQVRALEQGDPYLNELERPPEVIASRFEQGGRCLAAFKGEELVGCIWLNLGPYNEDEVRCRFLPQPVGKCAWDYDVYVVPAHRGTLAFARLWDAANDVLRSQQYGWTMSRVSFFNSTSRASHAKLGGRVVGSAVFIVFGSVQLMAASSSGSCVLALTRKDRPVIHVAAPPDSA